MQGKSFAVVVLIVVVDSVVLFNVVVVGTTGRDEKCLFKNICFDEPSQTSYLPQHLVQPLVEL